MLQRCLKSRLHFWDSGGRIDREVGSPIASCVFPLLMIAFEGAQSIRWAPGRPEETRTWARERHSGSGAVTLGTTR